jgi:hypothetical protein
MALRLNPIAPAVPIEATINEVNNRLHDRGVMFDGSFGDREGADLSLFHLDGKPVGPIHRSLEILGDLTTATIELHYSNQDALASGLVRLTRDARLNAQQIVDKLDQLDWALTAPGYFPK